MDELRRKPEVRMLMLIIDSKDVKKATALLKNHHLPVQYVCSGEGTASSEILDYLGLGMTSKAILTGAVEKRNIPELFGALERDLDLRKPNKGIAFTFPVSGASLFIMKLLTEEAQQQIMEHLERSEHQVMKEATNSLLLVMINQGYSEEVMNAARKAGAIGGTVVRARRLGSQEPLQRWGLHVQEEKEMIYILTTQENKTAIMKAIGENCGMHTEAQGVVLSIPVDAVAGLGTEPPSEC